MIFSLIFRHLIILPASLPEDEGVEPRHYQVGPHGRDRNTGGGWNWGGRGVSGKEGHGGKDSQIELVSARGVTVYIDSGLRLVRLDGQESELVRINRLRVFTTSTGVTTVWVGLGGRRTRTLREACSKEQLK